jgi:hypothetical protein
VAAGLPPINPHLHGHKKGAHVQSADDTSGGGASAAQVPAGLQQNLFGSLLNSLEQVIGLQATTPVSAATGTASAATTGAASAAATGSAATGSTGASAAGTGTLSSTANPVSDAARSSLTLLQNYLNNLLHNPRIDGSAAAKLAGSNLNVTA